MAAELWWVDGWLDQGEPLAEAVMVERSSPGVLLRCLDSYLATQAVRHLGCGELVLLDDAGQCLGGPWPLPAAG